MTALILTTNTLVELLLRKILIRESIEWKIRIWHSKGRDHSGLYYAGVLQGKLLLKLTSQICQPVPSITGNRIVADFYAVL